MHRGASIGGDGAARDEDVIARLLVGGGLLRRRRVRRLLLARLLNEAREAGEEPEYEEEEEEGEEGGVSDRQILRFLIASGVLRRRRMRRMLMAHLLRERGGEGFEHEFGEYEGGEGFGGFEGEEGGLMSDRKLARLLIMSGILRRRRVRQMVLAHLLRERGDGFEPEFERFGGFEGEEGPSSGHKLVRFLIASGILRRRRVRRMILAHLLRERGEGVEPEFGEYEGFEGEEAGGGEDRRIVRQLVASGLLRKRRIRQMLLARLLRERGEFGREAEEMEGEEFEGAEPGWGRGFGREPMHMQGGSAWGG